MDYRENINEDVIWDNDLMAPAEPLTKMALGYSTSVVAATQRALFVSTLRGGNMPH